jgi:hypothetical protein
VRNGEEYLVQILAKCGRKRAEWHIWHALGIKEAVEYRYKRWASRRKSMKTWASV